MGVKIDVIRKKLRICYLGKYFSRHKNSFIWDINFKKGKIGKHMREWLHSLIKSRCWVEEGSLGLEVHELPKPNFVTTGLELGLIAREQVNNWSVNSSCTFIWCEFFQFLTLSFFYFYRNKDIIFYFEI